MTELHRAIALAEESLLKSAMPSKQLEKYINEKGISTKTLYRALKRLPVKRTRRHWQGKMRYWLELKPEVSSRHRKHRVQAADTFQAMIDELEELARANKLASSAYRRMAKVMRQNMKGCLSLVVYNLRTDD